MGTTGNTLILLFGPTGTTLGINFLSRDVFQGLLIILLATFLTVIGSYYAWVEPKNRSKFWLIFPGLLTAFGYIPLMVLRKRKRVFDRLSIGFEVSKSTGLRDYFTFEAAKITKYYLELTRNYYDRFNDEVSLLAAAGLLDAKVTRPDFLQGQLYIRKTTSPEKITNIAKNSVLVKEDALVDFIINLEIELLAILYESEFEILEIKEACFEKREDIEYVVNELKREYVGEREFSWDTSKFLESHKFEEFRQALGINEMKHDTLVS